MGCGSSTDKTYDGTPREDEAAKAREEEAARQRRRLSMDPQLVGDISEVQMDDHGMREDSARRENPGSHLQDQATRDLYEVAADTRKGFVPYNRNKVNQDRHMVKFAVQDNPDLCLFGVMDGHGEFGHEVSSFVQRRLPQCLDEQPPFSTPEAIHHGIADAVQITEDDLLSADPKINAAFSGTTAVFSIKHGSTLYTANIGDSRCVMCRQAPNGAPEAIALSMDQNPDNPEEKARILAAGGRVHALPGLPHEDCGPMRVWLAQAEVPGLAMSRSIGDEVSHTVGVTSEPEIKEHEIQENDIFCIWASDGVWEFISNQEACEIVWEYRDNLKRAANELVKASNHRWKEEEEVVDDITVVLVGFNRAAK